MKGQSSITTFETLKNDNVHDEYVQKERPTENAISGDTEVERMAKSLRCQLLFTWRFGIIIYSITFCGSKVYTRDNFFGRLYFILAHRTQ